MAYVHLQSHARGKLDKRSLKCVFLGYSGTQKGYKCFCPSDRKIYTTLDVVFDENSTYYVSNNTLSSSSTEQVDYRSIIDITTVGDYPMRATKQGTNHNTDNRSQCPGNEDEHEEDQNRQERSTLPITQ